MQRHVLLHQSINYVSIKKKKFKQFKHILGNLQICQEYQFYSEYRIFKYKRMKTYIRITIRKVKHCPKTTKALMQMFPEI